MRLPAARGAASAPWRGPMRALRRGAVSQQAREPRPHARVPHRRGDPLHRRQLVPASRAREPGGAQRDDPLRRVRGALAHAGAGARRPGLPHHDGLPRARDRVVHLHARKPSPGQAPAGASGGLPPRGFDQAVEHDLGLHSRNPRLAREAAVDRHRGPGPRALRARRDDPHGHRERGRIRDARAVVPRRGAEAMIPTAARLGLLVCHSCSLVNRDTAERDDLACARCGAALHKRKPDSLLLSWILLPMVESGSLFGSQRDTILSGAKFLWDSGDWLIAVIIFVASIVLPAVKIAGLGLLLATAQRRSTWRPRLRARIYRVMEAIGRWSMVDIFVAAILVALVQFRTVAQVQVGPGAIAFAAVVIFTMFAAWAFDPRLIWDPVDGFDE